jgi:hypothetical protein
MRDYQEGEKGSTSQNRGNSTYRSYDYTMTPWSLDTSENREHLNWSPNDIGLKPETGDFPFRGYAFCVCWGDELACASGSVCIGAHSKVLRFSFLGD